MPVMTSQILRSVDFTKTQKSRCLENETIFSLNKKIRQLHIKSYFMTKKNFLAEVTFNEVYPLFSSSSSCTSKIFSGSSALCGVIPTKNKKNHVKHS